MNYANYTDDDLLEAHESMLDYSGTLDESLDKEIQDRGGLDQIKLNIRERKLVPDEIRRINKIVYPLIREGKDTESIKKLANSDVLDHLQLNYVIDLAIEDAKSHYKNVIVNSRTIIGSIIGFIVASLLSAGLWWYTILLTGKIYYILIGVTVIVSYLIIRILTGQNFRNVVVFIASFISAFAAIPLGLWIYRIITT
jgi:hypothetical protein